MVRFPKNSFSQVVLLRLSIYSISMFTRVPDTGTLEGMSTQDLVCMIQQLRKERDMLIFRTNPYPDMSPSQRKLWLSPHPTMEHEYEPFCEDWVFYTCPFDHNTWYKQLSTGVKTSHAPRPSMHHPRWTAPVVPLERKAVKKRKAKAPELRACSSCAKTLPRSAFTNGWSDVDRQCRTCSRRAASGCLLPATDDKGEDRRGRVAAAYEQLPALRGNTPTSRAALRLWSDRAAAWELTLSCRSTVRALVLLLGEVREY